MKKYQKGMIEVIVLGAGVIAVLVVGFLLFKTFKKAENKSAQLTQQIDQLASETTTTQVAKSAITGDLKTQIDTVQFDDIDTDFKDIDADLNSL
jgi:hypothetical protein